MIYLDSILIIRLTDIGEDAYSSEVAVVQLAEIQHGLKSEIRERATCSKYGPPSIRSSTKWTKRESSDPQGAQEDLFALYRHQRQRSGRSSSHSSGQLGRRWQLSQLPVQAIHLVIPFDVTLKFINLIVSVYLAG